MSSFVHHYGLAALFVIVMLESSGVPVPGETALVAAGVFAQRGNLDIAAVIAVAAVAAIVGDNIGYCIGRTGGRSVIERWSFASGSLPWSERFFHRHGPKTIFLARFFAVLRVTAAWLAGISRMHWWTFFAWNAAGGICWAALVGLVAYYVGQAAADAISHYGLIGGAVVVGLAAASLVALHFWRKRRGGAVVKRLVVVAAMLVLCGDAESATPAVPAFNKVVVVVLENKSRSDVLGNPAAPAFNAFARGGAVLSGYRGVTHPSLPNYLALVSGSTHGITSDCTTCTVAGRSLADTLEAKGLTWKTYAEGLPRPGWTGPYSGRYAKKHVPFLYFRRVLASPARLKRVVPLSQLARDHAAGKLPTFSLVVPDLCHDMHDCSVATGDAWLKRFLPPLLRLPGTAVFVVFDESDSANPGVPALALGTLVRPHSRFTGPTDHYSLLRTIEDGLGLPKLGRSARAVQITGIWRLPPGAPKEGSALRP